MKRLFKRKQKKNMKDWEYSLLKSIADLLPGRYNLLKKQINPDFILDSISAEYQGVGWRRIIYDDKQTNLYNDNEINCKLSGIQVYEIERELPIDVEIDLFNGIIIGYKIENKDNVININRIDISNLRMINYEAEDKDILLNIIGNQKQELLKSLDINDTYKIELSEGCFYVIKDFKDGNFLSMDNDGAVYMMNHDPYEIVKLFKCKEDFFCALDSGSFNMSEYYERNIRKR